MALPSITCDVPDEVCCSNIYDTAYHLLSNLFAAVAGCVSTECDTPGIQPYLTFGVGDDGIRDALTVAILQVAPSAKSQDGAGRTIPLPLYRCDFEIRLRESGWPIAQVIGGAIQAPDPVLQAKLSKHAFAHGELLYRKLNAMNYSRTLAPAGRPQPTFAQIGPLVPLLPTAGVVGWTIRVQLDMIWQ